MRPRVAQDTRILPSSPKGPLSMWASLCPSVPGTEEAVPVPFPLILIFPWFPLPLGRQSFYPSGLSGQRDCGIILRDRRSWSSPSGHHIWLKTITLHALLITVPHHSFSLMQCLVGSYFPEYTVISGCESPFSGQRWWNFLPSWSWGSFPILSWITQILAPRASHISNSL